MKIQEFREMLSLWNDPSSVTSREFVSKLYIKNNFQKRKMKGEVLNEYNIKAI